MSISEVEFSLEYYFNFINKPLPKLETSATDNIVNISGIVKERMSRNIGQIDKESLEKRFHGDSTPVFQFNTQTITDISKIEFTVDGYTWIEMPQYSYIFNETNSQVIRDPLYIDHPSYGVSPYDAYDENDPQTVFPSFKSCVRGNLQINYTIGYSSFDTLPSFIRDGWVLTVKELRDWSETYPLTAQPDKRQAFGSIDYEMLDIIIDKRFPITSNQVLTSWNP